MGLFQYRPWTVLDSRNMLLIPFIYRLVAAGASVCNVACDVSPHLWARRPELA